MTRSKRGARPSARSLWRFGVVVAVLAAGSLAHAEDWPQFRGHNASGLARESRGLPVEFSHQDNVLWSAELGKGVASPVVSRGRVYATSMVGDQQFAVFCLDADTGNQRWRRVMDTGPLPDIMPPNTHASSTPAADGERVYVHFSTLGLMALDADSGETRWVHKTPAPFYLLGWGAAQSLVLHEDLLIYNQDDDLAPFLLALDKHTGEVRWRTERPEMLAGYSTPVLCTAGGRTDLVVAGTGKLKGYDPQTGEERWTCNTLLRTMMTSPVVVDDLIYVSCQSYGDSSRVLKYALLQWKDTNQDGRLSKSELDEAFWEKFDRGDVNNDGQLVDDEIDLAFQAPDNMVGGGNVIQAIRGGGEGDVTKTHVVWSLENRSPSNVASPLVADGRLFVVKKGGIGAMFDAETGDTLWMQKRIGNFGNYYASPIAADGKIYVTGENGFIVVLQQGDQLERLAKNDMGDSCIGTPAVADGRLYIRTLKKLYCISEEATAEASAK